MLEALGDDPEHESDPFKLALRVLFATWPALCAQHGPDGLTSRRAIEVLYPPHSPREPPPDPDEFEELREAIETLCPSLPGREPDAKALGYKLRSQRSRVVDGKRLHQVMGHNRTPRWTVRPVAEGLSSSTSPPPGGDEGDGGDLSCTPQGNSQRIQNSNGVTETGKGQAHGPDAPHAPPAVPETGTHRTYPPHAPHAPPTGTDTGGGGTDLPHPPHVPNDASLGPVRPGRERRWL